MKQILLSISFVLAVNFINAQITISQNDFPGANDTALVSVSDDLTIDVTQTGAASTWNYADLHVDTQRIDTFFSMSDASALYQLQFNNVWTEPDYASDYYTNLIGFDLAGAADAGISIEKPVGFVKITSSVVQNVGMGMALNGIEVPMASDTIDTEYELPMNYLDSWSSNSYINVDLNPAFAGIFVRHQQRYSEVDGWGTITTPFGTFDALRVRSELFYDDSAYIDFGFGGTWIELPTPDEVQYTWWSQGNKIPILRVTAQAVLGTETVTRVEFKDYERDFTVLEVNTEFNAELYPNPANNTVNLFLDSDVNLVYIYNMAGELVFQNQVTSSNMTLDVCNWTSGVYMVKLIRNESVSSTKLVVE